MGVGRYVGLWSVTTERSDHLLGSVSLFVCLAGARGRKESQNNRSAVTFGPLQK